jgi:hypothetical protein
MSSGKVPRIVCRTPAQLGSFTQRVEKYKELQKQNSRLSDSLSQFIAYRAVLQVIRDPGYRAVLSATGQVREPPTFPLSFRASAFQSFKVPRWLQGNLLEGSFRSKIASFQHRQPWAKPLVATVSDNTWTA